MQTIGSWVDCINPHKNPVKHGFFRYVPSDKRFSYNDMAKICPICWYEAQLKNGTLKQAPLGNNTIAQMSHHTKCTPEKDSL